MAVNRYPLMVEIYKGEGRILILPIISHEGGFSEIAGWGVVIEDDKTESAVIGNKVYEMTDYIRTCPLSTSTPLERQQRKTWSKYSKYKSEVSFWKNNLYTRILIYENGTLYVTSMQRSTQRRCVYSDYIKRIELTTDATPEEIGSAVLDVFEAAEKFYGTYCEKPIDPYPPVEVELLDDKTKIIVHPPRDKHFEDAEDAHSGEVYQCYSYIAREGDEPSGYFALTMGPRQGLLDAEKIQEEWEGHYGSAESFTMEEKEKGIFTHFAEMRNKKIHRISYFLRLEEDLILECEMSLYQPNKRKKPGEKLQTMFEDFVLGCQKKND